MTERWNQLYEELEQKPDNFELWEDFLEYSVNGLKLSKASSDHHRQLFRFAFDGLLTKFPLLHGYWIRYATLEFRLGYTDRAADVYERALSICGGAPDLWLAYVRFHVQVSVASPERIAAAFERAAQAIGAHFLSHEFWDEYLDYAQQTAADPLTAEKTLLRRITALPIHQYAKYCQRLREVSKSKNERALLPKLFAKTKTQVMERYEYECELRRPSFRPVFLSQNDMAAWSRYLDYEEARDDDAMLHLLYERCFLSTGLYEHFWLRYARYLVWRSRHVDAITLLTRATQIVAIGKIEVRMYLARLYELTGEALAAKDIYLSLLAVLPWTLPVMLAYAGLLNRLDSANHLEGYAYLKGELDRATSDERLDRGALFAEVLKMTPADQRQAMFTHYQSILADRYIFWRCWIMHEVETGNVASAQSVLRAALELGPAPLMVQDLASLVMDGLLETGSAGVRQRMEMECKLRRGDLSETNE